MPEGIQETADRVTGTPQFSGFRRELLRVAVLLRVVSSQDGQGGEEKRTAVGSLTKSIPIL